MACLNDYFLSIILGIIEGLTEFLPVSSTAHLRIAEAILGVDLGDGYWKMFSIVIQFGAILCLPIYFWSRIMSFLSTYPKGKKGDKTAITHPLALTLVAFGYLRDFAAFDQAHRQESRKPGGDGERADDRRSRDVDRRCDLRAAERRHL